MLVSIPKSSLFIFLKKLLNNLYFKFDYEHFIKIKNEGKPIFMSNLK